MIDYFLIFGIMVRMTDGEKDIYNAWLKATAIANKRPYRIRKNFDDVDDSVALSLEKLYKISNNFPGINMVDYFLASYNVTGDKFINLEEFTKLKALRNYKDQNEIIKKSEFGDPERTRRMVAGFSHIIDFCDKNGKTFAQYIGECGKNGIYQWISDYSEHKITNDNLVGFDLIGFGVENAIRKVLTSEEISCIFGDIQHDVFGDYDTMTDENRNLLVSLMKRINKIIKDKQQNKK